MHLPASHRLMKLGYHVTIIDSHNVFVVNYSCICDLSYKNIPLNFVIRLKAEFY